MVTSFVGSHEVLKAEYLPDSSDDELTEEEAEFVAQLEADRSWALSYYPARNEEFERCEGWYQKQHYSSDVETDPEVLIIDESTEEDEHLTVIPLLTNVINSVHGILTDEDFYIECISSTGRKSTEAALKVARFCAGTYWINTQVQGDDPWETASLDQLVMGWGCVYSYWDPERAALSRAKGTGRSKDILDFYSYPIVVKRLNPKDIYPLPFGVREKWRGILWVVMRTVREIVEEWGVDLIGSQLYDEDENPILDEEGNFCYEELSDEALVEYVDYWVWKRDDGNGGDDWTLWHCIMANNQVVKRPTPMPEYEMLPFEIFFCRKSTSDAGSKMGLSFMYPLIEPVQELEYLANRQSRLIEMYLDPMLVVRGPQADQDIEKGPGTVIYTESDGDAHYLTWNGSPPDVNALRDFWQNIAQDAFPPVMSGVQGGTSGLDTIVMQSGGKLQTNKPRRNLELAIQRVNTKIIRLLQRFSPKDPIYVVGQRPEGDDDVPFQFSIKGNETRGFENTKVTVRGRFPQEELRNVAIAAQAVGSGIVSQRRASSKYLYVQDPIEERKEILREEMLKDPTFRQFFMQKYMQLPTKSPVSDALEQASQSAVPPAGAAAGVPGASMATNIAGGDIAAALATNPTQVQQGVQRTPVESNAFSAVAGGVPVAP